jgi:DNA polymerase-3 subunit delta'
MGLREIYGHEALLSRLGGALASSRFPQAALFVGPQGVGKQRIALWVAQGLLCEQGPGAPCGTCGPCHRVMGLKHPDLHWFVPIPRPKASDPGKQIDEARDALAALWEERRQTGRWGPADGMSSHALASVRLLQRIVALTPFEARRKVIILGDAERLVVQEASQEAANAILKVLEEPPADTTVILTAADPQALLPTIRSRVVPVRVSRVSDDHVRASLRDLEPELDARALERRAVLAEGCVGQALSSDDDADGPDLATEELLRSIHRGGVAWATRALAQMPWSARGDFSATLDALAMRIRAGLEAESGRQGARLDRWLTALERVDAAREDAQANVNPQLTLAVLARQLEGLM